MANAAAVIAGAAVGAAGMYALKSDSSLFVENEALKKEVSELRITQAEVILTKSRLQQAYSDFDRLLSLHTVTTAELDRLRTLIVTNPDDTSMAQEIAALTEISDNLRHRLATVTASFNEYVASGDAEIDAQIAAINGADTILVAPKQRLPQTFNTTPGLKKDASGIWYLTKSPRLTFTGAYAATKDEAIPVRSLAHPDAYPQPVRVCGPDKATDPAASGWLEIKLPEQQLASLPALSFAIVFDTDSVFERVRQELFFIGGPLEARRTTALLGNPGRDAAYCATITQWLRYDLALVTLPLPSLDRFASSGYYSNYGNVVYGDPAAHKLMNIGLCSKTDGVMIVNVKSVSLSLPHHIMPDSMIVSAAGVRSHYGKWSPYM